MNKSTRLIIIACVLLSSSLTTKSSPTSQLIPLSLDNTLSLDMKSQGVEWRGHVYYLVQLSGITFKLDEKARLAATIIGRTCSFDKANYKLYGAVFDASGRLLGTAVTACKVSRIWRYTVASTKESYSLDFGQSQSYREAKFFAVAISVENILTPDQWTNAEQTNSPYSSPAAGSKR